MSHDLDDLLGYPAPRPNLPVALVQKRRGRPPKVAEAPKPIAASQVVQPTMVEDDPDLETLPEGILPDVSDFMRPVRVTFLATVFGTEPRRLQMKLAKCPVLGWDMHKGLKVPVYDFKTACSYLLEPKMDIATWIKSQSPTSLPVHINKAFWEAENAKLRWMEKSRHFWHDEDVLDVLGRTAMSIKETTQLWIENLPGKATMTTEQYEAMQANVTELLDEIHQRLVEMPAARKTESVATRLDDALTQGEEL